MDSWYSPSWTPFPISHRSAKDASPRLPFMQPRSPAIIFLVRVVTFNDAATGISPSWNSSNCEDGWSPYQPLSSSPVEAQSRLRAQPPIPNCPSPVGAEGPCMDVARGRPRLRSLGPEEAAEEPCPPSVLPAIVPGSLSPPAGQVQKGKGQLRRWRAGAPAPAVTPWGRTLTLSFRYR